MTESTIKVSTKNAKRTVDPRTIQRRAKRLLVVLGRKNSELSVLLCDDAFIQQLNHQYRSIDKPTDVLSFPSGEMDPDSGQTYLGDVIISYDTALRQSSTAGHSISEELQLLVVHGCLHLLGHDHAEADEKKEMWAIQDKILNALGVQVRPND